MNEKEKETLKSVQEEFGKKNINFFSKLAEKTQVISSGSLRIDQILGIGGIPKGKIIEIYGNESSGKTTIALTVAASWQKHGMKVAFIDAERSLNGRYLKQLGVNLNELLLAQPSSGEQAFSIIEALIKADIIDLIIVDSVAALMPQAEILNKMDEQTIGLHARLMSRGLRRVQSIMHSNSASIIFINQLREKVGISFGNFETTTGGRALRFYSSIRMEVRRAEILKNGKDNCGIKSRVTISKSKLAAPFSSGYVNILFESGIDNINDEIEIALEKGIINQTGSWYNYQNTQLCQGRDKLKKLWIDKDNKEINAIKEELKAKLAEDESDSEEPKPKN